MPRDTSQDREDDSKKSSDSAAKGALPVPAAISVNHKEAEQARVVVSSKRLP